MYISVAWENFEKTQDHLIIVREQGINFSSLRFCVRTAQVEEMEWTNPWFRLLAIQLVIFSKS